MKKRLVASIVVLLFVLGLCGYYLSWNNMRIDKVKQNLEELAITAENISSTKAVLRLTHPEPEILAKCSISDDCALISKETGEHIEFLKEFNPAEFKEATPLILDADSSAVCEKNWEHLYGPLEPGEYAMGILISQKGFFRDRMFGPFFIAIEIPRK